MKLSHFLLVYFEDEGLTVGAIEKIIAPAGSFEEGWSLLRTHKQMATDLSTEFFKLLDEAWGDDKRVKKFEDEWRKKFKNDQQGRMKLYYSRYTNPELFCIQGWNGKKYVCVCNEGKLGPHNKWAPKW